MALTAMAKTTWWNRIRVDRNIRYIELLELFPEYKSESSIAQWFSGQVMPQAKNIRVLCDFFDVDFDEGMRHFAEANREWRSDSHHGKRELITGKREESENRKTELDARLVTGYKEQAEKTDAKNDIFETVYGKLPYDLFRKFCDLVADNNTDALAMIYGKVTYEEFITIQKTIQEG